MAHGARGYKAAREPGNQVHSSVDLPLLLAAVFFLAYHAITYLEVINCCHNLEIWLEEYFHGTEPVLERQYVGFFPSRIDFWTAILGMLGSLLYVFARAYVWVRSDSENFGVVDVKRDELSLIRLPGARRGRPPVVLMPSHDARDLGHWLEHDGHDRLLPVVDAAVHGPVLGAVLVPGLRGALRLWLPVGTWLQCAQPRGAREHPQTPQAPGVRPLRGAYGYGAASYGSFKQQV
ncbi:hypothetical protein ON010_g19063 [Phytophthora cinnamomi]|nr:hypothetical protein ON010_g19063 [Phytophthora cinnamomi]